MRKVYFKKKEYNGVPLKEWSNFVDKFTIYGPLGGSREFVVFFQGKDGGVSKRSDKRVLKKK